MEEDSRGLFEKRALALVDFSKAASDMELMVEESKKVQVFVLKLEKNLLRKYEVSNMYDIGQPRSMRTMKCNNALMG